MVYVAHDNKPMQRRAFIGWTGALAVGSSFAESPSTLVRMGYFDKYAPFSQRNEDGSVTGALIESVELVGRACGLRFEHAAFPWVRAQLMVERGDLDGFCTVSTTARLIYAEFCKSPLIRVDFGIYHRTDDLRPLAVRGVEDLRALRQGTYRGSGYSREHLEFDRLEVENDEESVLRRIAKGTLDTLVEGNIVTPFKLRQLGLTDRIRFTPVPFLPKADFCFGVRKSLPDASRIVANMEAATQAARRSGALGEVLAKYR
jgi:polar amino acid transport system substrate-binding protein